MADSKKYNGSTWEHSLRKLTTATEAVENPLYTDGTAITSYTIKGNTVQNGTPTPDSPVEVNGVGVRTENLFNVIWGSGSIGANGGMIADTNAIRTIAIPCEAEKTYTFVPDIDSYGSIWVNYYGTTNSRVRIDTSGGTFTTPQGCEQVRFRVSKTNIGVEPVQQYNAMFNEGSIAKTYEPYGYKIPISSGGVTTNIYLGSTQATRQIKKLVLTGQETGWTDATFGGNHFFLSPALSGGAAIYIGALSTHYIPSNVGGAQRPDNSIRQVVYSTVYSQISIRDDAHTALTDFKDFLQQQYAAGTPVTVWYILATPQTDTINEPLMKIGDYADTLSNATAIPTTEGANSITVDTTVQPSEFTATWTGWHNASVKEWDGSDWR